MANQVAASYINSNQTRKMPTDSSCLWEGRYVLGLFCFAVTQAMESRALASASGATLPRK